MPMSTSEWYAGFAVREAAGNSPTYERLAQAVAVSAEIIDRLDTLPESKRQPNLLFASTRALGVRSTPRAVHRVVLGNWDALAATMRTRLTQTNEPGAAPPCCPSLLDRGTARAARGRRLGGPVPLPRPLAVPVREHRHRRPRRTSADV